MSTVRINQRSNTHATQSLSINREKQSSTFEKLFKLLSLFNIDKKEAKENSHRHAQLAIRAFFFYMIFVSNILIISLLTQSKQYYLISKAFEHHLINVQFSSKPSWIERDLRYNPYKNEPNKYRDLFMINFKQISTFDDIWQFLNETVANVFYRSHVWKSNSQITAHRSIRWILDHFLMIGIIRMRQVRVKPEPCQIPKSFYDEISNCYPDYSSKSKDTDPFGPMMLNNPIEINLKQAWYYTPDNATEMDSYTGKFGRYDAGGYIADLAKYERTNQRFVNDITELKNYNWLDKATRGLFIDIITYNPSVNLFTNIKLVFEMPLTGGIFPSYKIQNRQLLRYVDSTKYLRILCEIIIVTFTIAFIFVEITNVINLKLEILLNFWNWIDIAVLIVSILIILSNIYRLIIVNSPLKGHMSIYISTFDAFTVKLLEIQSSFDVLSVLLTSISILRILKYCDFSITLVRIKATIQRCFGDLIGFLIMFVALMIAYAQFGNLALGQRVPAFSTIGKAFVALFRTVLGDFDDEAISEASPVIGPMFLVLYVFSMVFLLFNMVFAIIVDSYQELGIEHRDIIDEMVIDITPFMKDTIRKLFQRIGLWNQMKFILKFILGSEYSSNTKRIADLLQEIKYATTSSTLYEELRRAFINDMSKLISKQDFDNFLIYAQNDKDRQHEILKSLFTGNVSLVDIKNQNQWSEHVRNLCTIQQWAQLQYRIVRLDEFLNLAQAKINYTIRTSNHLIELLASENDDQTKTNISF